MINTLKNLVKLDIALIGLSFIAIYHQEPYLPAKLQEYLAMKAEATLTTIERIVIIVTLVTLLVHWASLFGLLCIKLWARKAYIYSTILLVPLLVFFGPSVSHAIVQTLATASTLVEGMILSLLIYDNSYQADAHDNRH